MDAKAQSEMMAALPHLTKVAEQVLQSKDIWAAIHILTEALGTKAGSHLETLVCKDHHR